MKRIIITLIFIFAFSVVTSCLAQTEKIADSLIKELDNTHDVESKIDIYLNLSLRMKDTDLNQAIELANHALVLAKKTNSISNLGLINSYLGEYALLQDSIDFAEQMFKNAAEYLTEINKPKELITVYLSIGNRYIEKDKYAEAMNFYMKGIELSENTGEKSKLPNLYNNLGIVYLNINKPQKALELYSKALKLFEEAHDTNNIAGSTTNIGSIYIQLEQNDIAESYYKAGYELFKEYGNLEGMAHSQLKLGLLDILRQSYDSATLHLINSLDLQKELEIIHSGSKSFFIAETFINLGIANFNLKNLPEAKEYLIEGHDIAMKSKQYRLIALSSEYLSKYYQNTDKPYQALTYAQVFKQYSDSSFNEENIRKLTQLEMQHQFDTKAKEEEIERKILTQRQERKILIFILISGGLLLLLIILILLLRLEKIGKRKADLERKSLSEKLEYTNKELTTYVMYLLRKNEFIISIAEKLKSAKLDANAENRKVITDLIKELESNSTMISWEEFEVRFQQVYTGFYNKLNNQFPDLTPNELRLCAFFRLNMTTKEIAAITYQSLNSITVARYRLRKKLGITTDEHLVVFLSKL